MNARDVITEVMSTPDKGIPQTILAGASCVVVIPGFKKGAFVVGAQYGQGVATCRTPQGWSAPVFVKLEGGSFGFQAGGQSTDLVLVAMNQQGLQHMLASTSSNWVEMPRRRLVRLAAMHRRVRIGS